jgi:epsilon-lactone hydrolase
MPHDSTRPPKASWQARAFSVVLRSWKRRHTAIDRLGGARVYVKSLRTFIRWIEPLAPHRRVGLRISTAAGAPVPAELIEPLGVRPRWTMLYLHGGGYLLCSPRTHRSLTTYFARQLPARVLVPDYRLAPEHLFPAGLEDALASYRWLRQQGIPAEEIVAAGDSAGGGLLLSMLLTLRDAGEALPAAVALMSPWTDLAGTGASVISNTLTDVWFYGESLPIAARLYLGGTPPTHPIASPLYADLHGLPPLIIHASDNEIVRDDSVRFAEKAKSAGVPVQLKVWPGLPHIWQAFIPFLPEARQSLDELAAFLRQPRAVPPTL